MRQMARQSRTLVNKSEAGFVVDANLGFGIYIYEDERDGWFSV
jgi:hypothetical protein